MMFSYKNSVGGCHDTRIRLYQLNKSREADRFYKFYGTGTVTFCLSGTGPGTVIKWNYKR
jgi:hypothetical protein